MNDVDTRFVSSSAFACVCKTRLIWNAVHPTVSCTRAAAPRFMDHEDTAIRSCQRDLGSLFRFRLTCPHIRVVHTPIGFRICGWQQTLTVSLCQAVMQESDQGGVQGKRTNSLVCALLLGLSRPHARSINSTVGDKVVKIEPKVTLWNVVVARIAVIWKPRLDEGSQATVCKYHCHKPTTIRITLCTA